MRPSIPTTSVSVTERAITRSSTLGNWSIIESWRRCLLTGYRVMPTSDRTSTMKCLTLTQPWAQLVVEGHKRYETRSWSTAYRGLIGIHASKGFPGWAKRLLLDEDSPFSDALNRPPEEIDCGAIVGVATVVACFATELVEAKPLSPEWALGDFSYGRFAWRLENPVRIWKPITAKGALGLWTPSPELERSIQAELARIV